LEFVRSVYGRMGREIFSMAEVVTLLRKDPALAGINSGFMRNEGYMKSLEQESRV